MQCSFYYIDILIDHFPKIFPNFSESQTNFPELFQKIPKIAEDFRGRPDHSNEFKYNLREKLDISESSISSLVQVNQVNSRAMSALTFVLFNLNTLQTKIVKL